MRGSMSNDQLKEVGANVRSIVEGVPEGEKWVG